MLGTFDSEEEAGIMYARARYKYPVEERDYSYQTKPCPLDLSEVPMNVPPIPSDKPGSASRFKGVTKNNKKWQARIRIPSEGGLVKLGTFDSEEEAGIMYARARHKYPVDRTSGSSSSSSRKRKASRRKSQNRCAAAEGPLSAAEDEAEEGGLEWH